MTGIAGMQGVAPCAAERPEEAALFEEEASSSSESSTLGAAGGRARTALALSMATRLVFQASMARSCCLRDIPDHTSGQMSSGRLEDCLLVARPPTK